MSKKFDLIPFVDKTAASKLHMRIQLESSQDYMLGFSVLLLFVLEETADNF